MRDTILRAVPTDTWPTLYECVRGAYDDVVESANITSFLQEIDGIYQLGHLRNPAVNNRLQAAVERGELPFTSEYQFNEKRTSPYFILENDEAIITVNQVRTPRSFPRDAIFRNRLSLSNPGYLPSLEPPWLEADVEKPYLIVTHGYMDFNFLCIGIPQPNNQSWAYRINIYEEMRSRPEHRDAPSAAKLDAPDQILDRAYPTLKSNVIDWLRSHKNRGK